jgi:hypothetical protein
VTEHVVQFPGDAQPLLGRGPGGALAFELDLPLRLQHLCLVQSTPFAGAGAEDPAADQQRSVDQDPFGAQVDRPQQEQHRQACQEQCHPAAGRGPGAQGGQRVEGHDRAQRCGAHGVLARGQAQDANQAGGQHGERVPAPQGQRRGGRHAQQHREGVRCAVGRDVVKARQMHAQRRAHAHPGQDQVPGHAAEPRRC